MAFRLLAAAFVALVLAPAASAVNAPSNLHAFQLKAKEPQKPTRTYSRTPGFAWNHVVGAERYEFQIATGKRFTENSIVYEDTNVKGPLTTVPMTLPWISGAKYSMFARVRAVVSGQVGPWSKPWGFNMRANGAPRSLSTGPNPYPGLVRWTPLAGATAYEVVFLYELGQGKKKKIRTQTTAADLREYYTLHNGQDWANVVYWRVRAVRETDAKTAQNGLPAVSYGPWSARFRTVEPALAQQPINLTAAVSRSKKSSDVRSPNSSATDAGPHELFPGFTWRGMLSSPPEQLGLCSSLASAFGITCPLYHVYVYTDADCVNRVHVSDLVGSPAYAPRLSPPLDLPGSSKELGAAQSIWLGDGSEGDVFDAGGDRLTASGVVADEGGDGESDGKTFAERRNSLWDNDFSSGRYYWTVVPVVPLLIASDGGEAKVEWHDVAFGQDQCAAGQVGVFGKTSSPVVENKSDIPFVSGMSSSGKLIAATTAKPAVFGKPVIAWQPIPSAQAYEIQWSKKRYPWKPAGKIVTPATMAQLDLPAGNWFYRIRGLDRTLPGPAGLSWSEIAQVKVIPRTFDVASIKLRRVR